MIVYVIEEGEYSDRRVVAVRETLEEAKAYVDLKQKSGRGYRETYGISAYDTQGNIVYCKDAYRVCFHNGDINAIDKDESEVDYLDWCECESQMIIHADSKDQARKIAYDRLAELKARKEGIV